jgi:hypothetical protein
MTSEVTDAMREIQEQVVFHHAVQVRVNVLENPNLENN